MPLNISDADKRALAKELLALMMQELDNYVPPIPNEPEPDPDPEPENFVTRYSRSLGPTWSELNPNGEDTRPLIASTPDKEFANKTGVNSRVHIYNVGEENPSLKDYWSTSGQVIYIPDRPDFSSPDPETKQTTMNPGIDRIQTFACYDGVMATSPRLDPGSAADARRPEHYRRFERRYWNATQPIAMVRNDNCLCNEALILSENGYLITGGTQTSRSGGWPLPVLKLPDDKKPTGALAVTSGNEFALIGVTDTATGKGQVAVVALEGKHIPRHAWPYMGLYNRGSWSDMKLLGFVDTTIVPEKIAAASNGYWESESQTAGKGLDVILLSNPVYREGIANGKEAGWVRIVATSGYAIISSKSENKVAFLDLKPIFQYMRDSWLADFDNTLAARGPAPEAFPQSFDVRPTSKPVEVASYDIEKPTCVLAGHRLDRWSADTFSAYAANEAGTITIFDPTQYIRRFSWEDQKSTLRIVGSFEVGKNPTHMTFARHELSGVPLVPKKVDPENNFFWVACRGDRKVCLCVTHRGKGVVWKQVQDKRIEDPIHVHVTDRANIVTISDFYGRKIHSIRVGTLVGDWKDKAANIHYKYPVSPEATDIYEYSGSMDIPGYPLAVTSANVN